jgi:Ala-tRNA(Pro) deacylase
MEIPKKLLDFLNAGEVGYQILHHPEAFTAQTIAQAEHVKGQYHAKVVMVKSGGQHMMAVLPADHRVDLEKFEKITGKPVAVESESEFKSLFPECAVGTMPPFGSLYGLPLYLDKSLSQRDYIVFEAGTHTDAIKLDYSAYERLAKPQIAEFAIKARPMKQE